MDERTRAGMATAAADWRRAGRRRVPAEHPQVRRARALKAQRLTPADVCKAIGAGRTTVYRYLSLGRH